MYQGISGSTALPGSCSASSVGVVPGHWGVVTCCTGKGGAISAMEAAGLRLEGVDREGPEVAGEVMDGPKVQVQALWLEPWFYLGGLVQGQTLALGHIGSLTCRCSVSEVLKNRGW